MVRSTTLVREVRMLRLTRLLAVTVGVLLATATPAPAYAQALETESARLLRAGSLVVAQNVEFQTSSDGTETALPFSIEYALTDRLELLVEPVPYTAIRPRTGSRATGLGDLEATLIGLVASERGGRPALALAGEVKLPTAPRPLIGTGATDFTGYLIASKRFGRLDAHVNVGYSILGRPAGALVQNIVSGAIAGEYTLAGRSEFFAEVLANTSGTPAGPESVTTPEVAGGAVEASVGFGRHLTPSLFGSFSVSVDDNGAVLFRPGVTWRLH
jgi:hypothetical protein